MPSATSSTWTRRCRGRGTGSGAACRLASARQVAELGVVAGAVDAAGLDDHAGQALVSIILRATWCASYFVSS